MRGKSFVFPERSEVTAWARSADAVKGDCYVAVSVPLWPLTNAVRLPDGRRAVDADAKFDIECRALLERPDTERSWRTIPVHVAVTLLGYERLKFEWCINDGTPALQTMKAMAPETD